MAELHVQKKETNIWPWIIGLIVVAAVVWYAFGRSATTDSMTSRTADSTYQTPGAAGTATNPNPGTP